jgi:hypothetical protein
MSLKEKLADWTDWDGAMCEAAALLGIVEHGQEHWLKNKHLFWSAGPIDDMLFALLQNMVKAGFLEYREEPDQQYRWKP